MKKFSIILISMFLSASAFAVDGFVCEAEESDKRFVITILDDVSAEVEETVDGAASTDVVDYRRVVVGEHRAFSSFHLSGNRNLDVIENYEEIKGVILLRNYHLEIYKCETLN